LGHGPDQGETLRDLVARLIDSAKAYARAEIALARQTVASRLARARPAIVLLACALLFAQAALTVLVGALGMLLASCVGVAGGLAIAALLALAIAAVLGWLAIRLLRGAGS
jgi:hypothetical protein